MKKIYAVLGILLLTLGIGVFTTTPFTTKIGESVFYKDDSTTLKVVLIHEHLPFHYIGNHYFVACQTAGTAGQPEHKWEKVEKGWSITPQAYLGNGLGSDSQALLQSLSEEAKKVYLLKDKKTLVILDDLSIDASFDGCRTYASWRLIEHMPTTAPRGSTPEYAQCLAAKQKDKEADTSSYSDCTMLKFSATNTPTFQNITASDQGNLSFDVRSPAFPDGLVISTKTSDFGKTWQDTSNKGPMVVTQNGTVTDNIIMVDAPSYLEVTKSEGRTMSFTKVIYSGDSCVYPAKNGFDIKKGSIVEVRGAKTDAHTISVCDSSEYYVR